MTDMKAPRLEGQEDGLIYIAVTGPIQIVAFGKELARIEPQRIHLPAGNALSDQEISMLEMLVCLATNTADS